jgi:tetratricopeptide (TPR) repeat protein
LGSLRTLTILLALGAWGAATEGAPPGDGTSSDGGTTRASLPAPAVEYLKGGIRLFNTGDQANAAKYLKVASDYRDQLQPAEQTQLDDYLGKLNPAPTDTAVKPASTSTDPAPVGSAPAASPTGSSAPAASPAGSSAPATPRSPNDVKQDARWKLQGAREQMRMGNYDEAMRVVLEVQKMNVKWGLFDETPAKLAEAIAKARPKGVASTGGAHDRKQALAKLAEAREMLKNNQFEQAESIALEVNSWGVSFGAFDDKPSKVAAAARALRKRDEARNTLVKFQDSPNTYDYLVSEARHKMQTGELDIAEEKARQALRMNVYPSPTSDRAEAVLNDIALARAGTKPASAPTLPVSSPSVRRTSCSRGARTRPPQCCSPRPTS